MHLPSFIAWRYLFAKKSHNVINIISLISTLGIVLGTMALIIVLSVYNGFQSIVDNLYSKYEADLVILPASGKTFNVDQRFVEIKADTNILAFSEVIEENIFTTYDTRQSIATIKGIDHEYEQTTPLSNYLVEGEFKLKQGEINQCVLGLGLSRELGVRTSFISPLEIYFPRRNGQILSMNPATALNKVVVFPSGIISIQQSFDNNFLFAPIESARKLLEYAENEVSYIELRLKDPEQYGNVQKSISKLLDKDLVIRNRYQQNETVYKMMKYEKIVIYMILLFIILVITCNIFGSLSMLIIEKKNDIETLRSMGATPNLIRKIFLLEGWFISLFGTIIGLVLGLLIALAQQHFKIISMPGNFIIDHYPMIVMWQDVGLVFIGTAIIGLLVTSLPARTMKFS